jgi:hypothetical protein
VGGRFTHFAYLRGNKGKFGTVKKLTLVNDIVVVLQPCVPHFRSPDAHTCGYNTTIQSASLHLYADLLHPYSYHSVSQILTQIMLLSQPPTTQSPLRDAFHVRQVPELASVYWWLVGSLSSNQKSFPAAVLNFVAGYVSAGTRRS